MKDKILMKQSSFCKLLLAGLAALPLQVASGLQMAGSDLLDTGIRDAILEELQAVGIDAEMSLEGSLSGLSALEAGDVDACIAAVPDGSDPVGTKQAYAFGFQIVAFAVNENNPLTELDYAELGNLFRAQGAIESWTELISLNDWRDRKVNLWAARSEKAIVLEIFNSVVLEGSPLKDSIRYTTLNREELMRIIANDISGLMAIPNIKPVSGVRILAVKAETAAQSYKPSEDNVFYGDYPLRLPFKLVVNKDVDAPTLAALLRAIYSERVTRALENAFYMPVPLTERQAVLAQLN